MKLTREQFSVDLANVGLVGLIIVMIFGLLYVPFIHYVEGGFLRWLIGVSYPFVVFGYGTAIKEAWKRIK